MVLENFTSGYDVANGSIIATGEKNDCTVRAIANAFNVCYDVAHDYAKTIFGRENRKGIRGFAMLLSAVKTVSFSQTMGQLDLFEQSSNYRVKGLSQSQLINPQYKHKIRTAKKHKQKKHNATNKTNKQTKFEQRGNTNQKNGIKYNNTGCDDQAEPEPEPETLRDR